MRRDLFATTKVLNEPIFGGLGIEHGFLGCEGFTGNDDQRCLRVTMRDNSLNLSAVNIGDEMNGR